MHIPPVGVVGNVQHEQKSLHWRDASVSGPQILVRIKPLDPGRATCGGSKSSIMHEQRSLACMRCELIL